MRKLALLAAATATTLAAGTGAAVALTTAHAGPQGNGTSITPGGWLVTPAGSQTTLGGTLPTAAALSPDGTRLLTINAGDGTYQSVQAIDPASGQISQTIKYKSPAGVYGGVAYSPDGTHAYASGGGSEKIHVYSVTGGTLTEDAPIQLPSANPAGQAVNMYPAGLAVTPDGKRLVVADQMADAASVIDLPTGRISTVGAGHNPYGVAISPDGRTAYVSNQGASTVTVLDISGATPRVTGTIPVGTHPNRMVVDPRTGTLYVANSETDSVSVVPPGATRPSRTISLAPYPGAPVGSNPDGLALSPGGGTLYVVNSGDNDVDVVNTRLGRVRGMIPTAWYPTSVTVAQGGRQLLVTNGKGLGAGPNPNGPNPYTDNQLSGTAAWQAQYAGTMIRGSLSSIAVPGPAALAHYTGEVRRNDGFGLGARVRNAASGNPVPARPGEPSPIKHVIYIVRENRTYDQEFGSLGKGNGDPSLDLFGDHSAPNSRALERRFVTLDNTYTNAEISAQGWNWSVGANSNPYVEQTWVDNYSGRNHPYDYEGGNNATAMNRSPLDSYIWDKLADAHIPFRNYGFYHLGNSFDTGPDAADPRLVANTDPNFYGFDLNCPDAPGTWAPRDGCTPRYTSWLAEFQDYVKHSDLPAVELLRLPNDHTIGTDPGYPTPKAYVADNDYALGRVVDTVSHSKYWKSTAIFVIEDDSQAGPDHVDAHRTTAEIISPYTQTGKVDSTFYSTVSMLRTIELIVGLGPMTQFDASAMPMFRSFTDHPDFRPYNAIKPPESILTSVNPANAPLARQMAKQDFHQQDMVNEQLLNEAIWKSVKGAGSPMPPAQHHVIAPSAASSG